MKNYIINFIKKHPIAKKNFSTYAPNILNPHPEPVEGSSKHPKGKLK
jgi:hypothetical protein